VAHHRAEAIGDRPRLNNRGVSPIAAIALLFTVLLAACSTAPTRNSNGGAQPYARIEPGAPRTLPPGLPQFIDHSVGEEEISIEAMSLVGVPYRWGGNTPDSGFDCSGLVTYVVRRAAAVNLPRTTEQMESVGTSINPDEISPGDLIFFNTTGRAHSHVGIYVGQYRFVNAPSTGGTVRIDYVSNPYWAKRFDGIRRVASGTPHGRPFDIAPLEAAAPSPAPQAVAALQPGSNLTTRAHLGASPDSVAPQSASSQSAPETAELDAEPQSGRSSTRLESTGTSEHIEVTDSAAPDLPSQAQSSSPANAANANAAAANSQSDPIAEIANLSGAGAVAPATSSAVAPPASPAALQPLPSVGRASASPPQSTGPSAAPALHDNSADPDPIAGFANSKL
jgi:hypothetical protein